MVWNPKPTWKSLGNGKPIALKLSVPFLEKAADLMSWKRDNAFSDFPFNQKKWQHGTTTALLNIIVTDSSQNQAQGKLHYHYVSTEENDWIGFTSINYDLRNSTGRWGLLRMMSCSSLATLCIDMMALKVFTFGDAKVSSWRNGS